MSVKNLVQCPLITPVSSTATELLLGPVSAPYNSPPLDGGLLVISDSPSKPSFVEFIKYTHRIDNVLYGVSRGQEDTAARNWSGVTYVYQALTADQYTQELAGKEPVIAAGAVAQYWRGDKSFQDLGTAIRAANLAGLSLATNSSVAATDTILAAFGKLQAQVSARLLATANAVSASKLATARTLSVAGDATGSLTFDGSANVSMDVTLQPSGVTAGTFTKVTVDSKGRVTAGAVLLASDVPTLNQSTTGNAATATKLAAARSISLGGDVTGSTSFDGSGNVTITATYKDSGVVAGTYTKLTVDAKGNVTAGASLLASDIPTLNQNTTGNAATATKLATARTINNVAFDGSADITIADGTKEPAFAAGTTAQYRRGDKTWQDFATAVRAAVMTGLSTATATAVLATDTLLAAVGKLQAQVTGLASSKLDTNGSAASLTSIPAAQLSGVVPNANLSGAYTGVSIDGNAGSATKLATARTINNVSFDGTANITVADSTKAPLSHTHTAAQVSGLGTAATKNITISTAAPSGGADGDLWIQY